LNIASNWPVFFNREPDPEKSGIRIKKTFRSSLAVTKERQV
jgi:hypothetical protein